MLQIDAARLSSLIEGFYAAAYGRQSWHDTMSSLNVAFHGSRACMFTTRMDVNGLIDSIDNVIASVEDPEFISKPVLEEMLHHPAFQAISTKYVSAPPGSLVLWSDVVDVVEFRDSDFWRNWLRPREMFSDARSILGSSVGLRVNRSVGVSRGPRQGDFDDQEEKLFNLLAPHIRRSCEITDLLGAQFLGLQPWEAVSFGLVAVEKDGRVIHANGVADRLFARTDTPIAISRGQLSAVNFADGPALAKLISDAFADPEVAGSKNVVMFPHPVAGDDCRDRLVLSAAPLLENPYLAVSGESCAIVIIREMGTSLDQEFVDLLSRLFGLPPAFARLAARLSSGMPIKEAAAANGLTYASARTYLQTILERTGTRRQTELVALLKSIELLRLR